MSSRHLLDPQIAPILDMLPSFDFTPESLAQNRAALAKIFKANQPPTPDGVTVTEHFVPSRDGEADVRVLISAPTLGGTNRPGVLHIHGGGYVMGAAEMSLGTNAAYVSQLGAVAVAVDYRLAPETPHPGPVEDCYAVLAWLFANADSLGIDVSRIAIGGESAGGGMAAGLGLLARDRGEYKLAFQHLIFPMLDDRTTTVADASPYLGQYVWTRANNVFGWTSLLGHAPGGPNA